MTLSALPIRSALIVEDDGIISMMLEDMMTDLGVNVLHVCSRISDAAAVAGETDLDCAVLDVHIHNGSSIEIAEILARRGVPFVISSGYSREDIDPRFRDRPYVSKPFSQAELRDGLLRALDAVRSRSLDLA